MRGFSFLITWLVFGIPSSSFERHHHCGSRCCHRGDDGAVWRVLRGSEEC